MAKRASSNRSLTRKLASTVKSANSAIAAAGARGQDTSGAQNAVNRSNSMLAQTKAQGSRSYIGSSFEKEYNATPLITADKVSPVAPLKMPVANVYDPGNMATQMNTALAPSLAGSATLNPTTGMFDPVTGTPPAEPTPQSNLQAYLANLTAAQGSQPNAEVTLRQLEKESGLKQAKQDVNNYTGQLNAITAKSQADQLRLEGQGRGITDTLIGGQQAQINREAAIAALPVQAQLAAAQGNLQMAQEHVDKMFSIRMQDAQNKYAFQTKIADTLFQYANAEQERKMQAKKEADNRAFSVMQNDQSFARQLAMQAVEFGQTGLAAKLGNLVPGSATYAQDIGALQGQLRKPVAPRAAVLRQTEMFEGKLIDSQTGEVIRDLSGGAGGTADAQKSLDQITFLKTTIGDAEGLVGATGPNMITKGIGNLLVGNTKVKQLDTKLNSLKTNLLSLNADPALKKFFGPQMSEKDSQMLLSAGSTLDAYSGSVRSNQAELTRYSQLLNRMETSIRNGMTAESVSFGIVLTAPDGQLINIVD